MDYEYIVMVVLIAFSAFFSCSETALTSISRLKIRQLVHDKAVGSKSLHYLASNSSKMLSTILLGNTFVNIAASIIGGSIAMKYTTGNVGLAISIATGIMTFLILVFGEITPKTVAIRNAGKIAPIVAPMIVAIEFIFRPIIFLLSIFSTPFIVIFGGKVPHTGIITEEEIKALVSIGEKEGVIERAEKEMIASIFEFGDTTVREVMTPRPDIKALEINTSFDEALKLIMDSGHSRIPIYEGNMDNIVGIVYAKDLLKVINKDSSEYNIRFFLRPALTVPETKKIDDLLHQMQAARTHIAVIADEYGDTSGIVSLEDLIEEIVGEIHDEFEKKTRPIEKKDKNTVIIDGKLSIKDTNKLLNLNIPEKEEEYNTISGFVSMLLGKIPAVGDVAHYNSIIISVERVHKRRITQLKIVRSSKPAEEEFAGG